MCRVLLSALLACALNAANALAQGNETSEYAEFVEPGFPFITTTVVAESIDDHVPDYNWSVRGLVIQLGADVYFCFDPDLLRMAVAWEGEPTSMATMAQVSYHMLNKGNAHPQVRGDPIAANGMYAGWMPRLHFDDPREPGLDPNDPGKGPLPAAIGAFEGVYVHGDAVVLSYRTGDTHVYEQPGLLQGAGVAVVARTFEVGASEGNLTLAASDVPGAHVERRTEDEVVFDLGDGTVAAVFADGASSLRVRDGRYVTLTLPPSRHTRMVRVALWKGDRTDLEAARSLVDIPASMVDGFLDGGPSRWPEELASGVDVAPDTSAYVYDHVQLPEKNPWRRNVRPADLAFFNDGRAAIVTFDGDVWIADDLHEESQTWRRFASGMYEPLAIEIVEDEIYVYGREGIVRLHDLNGDGEADFYEAFAPGIIQSTLSREWPLDMVERPGGGFFVSQGGALQAGPTAGHADFMPGFLRGSPHNGAVLEVSADGDDIKRYATGFRGPMLGMHPERGILTASDQQGNFVPSTPLYVVEEGGYYGVPATAHISDPLPNANQPLTWIPHRIDPSGTGQVWMTGEGNGPIGGHLVHLSYGYSGAFRVYFDSLSSPVQGAVTPVRDDRLSPTLKGAINPSDDRLYVAGFQIWGTTAERLKSLRRLRYTGAPVSMPSAAHAGAQGILLTFEEAIAQPNAADIDVVRYNYRRTSQYGSGHYRLDGSEGEERLSVAALHLSPDARTLLIVVPDMREAMQVAIRYDLTYRGGHDFSNATYFTLNDVRPLQLARFGLDGVDWQGDVETMAERAGTSQDGEIEASAMRGRQLYRELGCAACHSTDGSTAGTLGPTFAGLYGSMRKMQSGAAVEADEAYLKTSMMDPAEHVVLGFAQEMPSFRGIMNGTDVESMILFIKTLNDASNE